MADDKKISGLAVASALSGAELAEVVQGGGNKRTTVQAIANLAAGGVTSVNSQTGAVVLEAEDIPFTPSGSIAATDVQAAIEEISSDLEGVNKVLITGTTVLTSTAFGKIHICSGTSADYTVTLPTAVGNEGKMILLKGDPLVSNFNKAVTIEGDGTEKVDHRLNAIISTGGWCTVLARVTSGVGSWDVISFDQGYYIAWTPTLTGLTGASLDYKYKLIGPHTLHITMNHLTAGTGGGATQYTFTLPNGWVPYGNQRALTQVFNNSALALGFLQFTNGSNVVTTFTTITSGAWHNSALDREILGQATVDIE